jgi:uncharacterized protein (DUF305 family)
MKTSLFALPLLAALIMGGAWVTQAGANVSGRAGRAEIRFLEGMSDHHQMAVDMGKGCVAKAVTDDLRALCQKIVDAQTGEIQQMHDWLLSWYTIDYTTVPMSQMAAMPTEDAMAGMSGMAMDTPSGALTDPAGMMGMVAGLDRAEGKDYEIAWLESMIDHHDDALHMSGRVLKYAQHPELIALAHNIIAAQTAEIQTMEAMLTARGDR